MATATIAEFLEPSLWVMLMYVYKRRKGDSGGVKQVLGICLVVGGLLWLWCGVVWCSTVVLILGSACEEIDRGWAHWESGVRCVGGQGLDSWGAPMGADWATIHD